MSTISEKQPRFEDTISSQDDTLGASVSLSIEETSIKVEEKPKVSKNAEAESKDKDNKEKWWLKKMEALPVVSDVAQMESKTKQFLSPSPDVSSSMKEFLEKEKMCKDMHKNEMEGKDDDDTLCDILASATLDKYPSDFENATDEDIGSLLEKMSKMAGAISSNSIADSSKSKSSIKTFIEEEKSVEELFQEAKDVVRRSNSSLSKSGSKTDTLVPENIPEDFESLNRVRQLEDDIFQKIEEEVRKGAEKMKKSPKNEKRRETSPGVDILYENIANFRVPKTLELQRRKFEEQKVEVSSSSDLDDPIDKHSRSEDLKSSKKIESDQDNLQKEIIDVDKNFFEHLLRKTKDGGDGTMSDSSSFGQEDFSNFLKLLQGQADKKEQESNESNRLEKFPKSSDDKSYFLGDGSTNDRSPEYPEKEITDILEKELPPIDKSKMEYKFNTMDSNPRLESREQSQSTDPSNDKRRDKKGSDDKDQLLPKKQTGTKDNKNLLKTNEELYTVDLTPRLQLFADTIPKLLAEKSNEESKSKFTEDMEQERQNVVDQPKTTVRKTVSSTEVKSIVHPPSSERKSVYSVAGSSGRPQKKELKFAKSKSYDQICKPPFRSSIENLRGVKAADSSRKPVVGSVVRRSPPLASKLKPTISSISKIVPKTRICPKPKKDIANSISMSSARKRQQTETADVNLKTAMAGGDTKYNCSKQNWETLYREEKQKNVLLKQQLESEEKMYKNQINSMRVSFDEELFALKKQNIVLKAKLDEVSLSGRRLDSQTMKKNARVTLLEKEVEKQESLIRGYEMENKKLIQETKRMQETIKQLQKQKSTGMELSRTQELEDRIKDLEEDSLKLNLEVSELREKNAVYVLKNDDLSQQNSLLNDELEMFRDQLRTKNDFITDRLQAMSTAELELKKQAEDLKMKLNSKTEHLRVVRQDLDKLQDNVLPLEKELLEMKVKESNLQEKLQVAKSHVEREKQLTQKLKDQVILDSKKITDLNRQVREMERILKRKNPDSVSALILTANSEQDKIGVEKVKLLEGRIVSLENEIKAKDDLAQEKLLDFQRKFSDMKDKYLVQIKELQEKLLELTEKERKVCNDMFTQTAMKPVENKAVETMRKEERAGSFEKEDKKEQKSTSKTNLRSQNPKDDAYLMATIRGLKLELTNKDKTTSKMTKELQELQKTNRRLQKEREKLLNDRRSTKTVDFDKINRNMVSSDSKLLTLKGIDGNDQNSNIYQNGHASDMNNQRLTASAQRIYDPLQFTENGDSSLVKRLTDENDILKEELSKINKDFMALKNKRLYDLNLLQEEHEREMATLLKEYSVKLGDSKVVKLQGQINTQTAVISHLKQQVEQLRDYKEQVVVLKAERDHLENKVKTLNDKIKYLSTPSTEQLKLLQDKITILQQRHESREMTLQSLVRDLLRNRTQCKDCRNEKGKNRQLCYFRQELDHILCMLQEIANVH